VSRGLLDEVRGADVVVLGAGAAGATAALALLPRRVDVLTKGRLGGSGASALAQGGIAAAWSADDSPRLHARDTLAVAGGLADAARVALLTQEAPERVRRLIALGARFDRDAAGGLELGREAAHSRRRIVHAGDATGAEIMRVLARRVRAERAITPFEESFVCDLLVEDGAVAGAFARHPDGRLVLHRASAVVLATGGLGQLYRHTTNPKEATGDGLALAWRAGARVVDLEFVQFHPTALASADDPLPLLTEALRGAGARLVDEGGAPLLAHLGERPELLPRDIVARALFQELARGSRPHLDARGLGDSVRERFPTAYAACRARGLDLATQAIPVTPAAHYHMGGVAVDTSGRTSVAGLYACGEVASSGVHGANRLASNSLLEALVFGERVAAAVREDARATPPRAAWPALDSSQAKRLRDVEDPASTHELERTRCRLRSVMWEKVGLLRDRRSLSDALAFFEAEIERLPSAACETLNLLGVGRLIAQAALLREETRGSHYRLDHPETADRVAARIALTRRGDDAIAAERLPVAQAAAAPEAREARAQLAGIAP
jgi:L-aspartate oxidase